MRPDERLLDLLAARATEGLTVAESEELDRALAGHDDLAGDDLEIAAAAIYLAFDAADGSETMPDDVKTRLFGSAGQP